MMQPWPSGLIQGGLTLPASSGPLAQIPTELPSNVSSFAQRIGSSVGNLIVAVVVLVAGWVFASVAASTIQKLLRKTDLDNRVAAWVTGRPQSEAPRIEQWVARTVFWLLMLFVLVAFFQALGLTSVVEPLNQLLTQVTSYLPQVFAALVVVLIAWLLATVSRVLIRGVLQRSQLDQRFSQVQETRISEEGTEAEASPQTALSDTLANVLYWSIFLLFLPSVLSILELEGTLPPVQNLLNQVLSILPNVAAALVIGAFGWLLAQVVRRLVTNLLVGVGTDQLGSRFGLDSESGQTLSRIIGTVVFVLVLIPVGIASFEALRIQAISGPAVSMLTEILNALPQIFTAGLILVVTYLLAQFVQDLVTKVLTELGFNNLFVWLGLQQSAAPTSDTAATATGSESASASPQLRTPSELAGIILLVGLMLFATVAAVDVLGIEALTEVMTGLLQILGQVLTGMAVFAVGLYFATLTFNLIRNSGFRQAPFLAFTARIAIIIFSGAMALRQIGIAADIVNLAFGLLLGSIAVGVAIAFGVGGREVAAEQLREWLNAMKSDQDGGSQGH